jgi:cold shock CspA family protein
MTARQRSETPEVAMEVPVQIVLKKVPQPNAVRAEVMKAANVLERFHRRITSCRVAVTNPDARHREGGLFDVHVVLKVPGHGELVVSRRAEDQPEREHLNVALRKAFAQARRRLQDSAREMRGDVKARTPRDVGRVSKLFGRSGYGILETDDGREIYFHRNSVAEGKFRELKIGTHLRFVETEGEKGPQASTVVPVDTKRATRGS